MKGYNHKTEDLIAILPSNQGDDVDQQMIGNWRRASRSNLLIDPPTTDK